MSTNQSKLSCCCDSYKGIFELFKRSLSFRRIRTCRIAQFNSIDVRGFGEVIYDEFWYWSTICTIAFSFSSLKKACLTNAYQKHITQTSHLSYLGIDMESYTEHNRINMFSLVSSSGLVQFYPFVCT